MSEHRPALEHIQAYADHLRLEEKSAATVEKYLRDVRAFARWLEGREITKERTAAWKTHLVERGYAPASVNAMLSALNEMGGRLYLLGAKPGVAEEAGRRICARYSDLVLCGTHDGYFKDEQAILPEIAAAKPDLLFVCLGAPKQEKWMARWGQHTGAKLAIGLGGCLDVFAGNVERAPERWQKLGLEWAYRLKKEPKRIGRMAKLPLVLVKAAGQRVHPGKPNKKGD